VKIANGMLTIRGEKQEVKEEGEQDYRVRERSFGSFECSRCPVELTSNAEA
jgi:HSP20 family protein